MKRPQPVATREKPMKKLLVALALASSSLVYLMSVATEAQQVQTKPIQGKTTLERTVTVPEGQTYVKLDRSNRAIGTFAAGHPMGVLNCAQVPCPSTFKPGTVCWKCEESAELQRR
jgi:hypothetical protein